MSKTSDLSLAVAELKRCGEALIGISAMLADYFNITNDAATEEQPTPKAAAPEEKPISLEMVRAVLAENPLPAIPPKCEHCSKNMGLQNCQK